MKSDISSCRTLIDLLKWRADNSPEQAALIVDGISYTYKWLWENSQSYAAKLLEEKVKENDRVVLLVPNSAPFFLAFYGCILTKAIVVPIFPGAGTDRCSQIMSLSGSSHLILPEGVSESRKKDFEEWAAENEVNIHWLADSYPTSASPMAFPVASADDIAFIQYTSGSTGFPKGVPLSHYNLLTNVKQMIQAMDITGRDVFVSWLPVYHDMGLILNTMVPFFTGAVLVLLEEGMHRIHSWLKAIEKYGGTFIAAPDIAYRICVKGIRRPADYDLSSLRVALNASEPIHLDTYKLFEETFNLTNVMAAGYGLAEATVAVTMHPPGQKPKTDNDGYVASGKAVSGVDIRIDTEDFSTNTKAVGEILVKSPALMNGYFNKGNTPDPFNSNGYLKTGDIGYLDSDGYLYVLSRKKNIIIHAGHTLYPDDVEQVIASFDEIRQVAAIGIDNPKTGAEGLYLFVELRRQKPPPPDKCHNLIIDIVQRIYSHFGIRPGKVYLLKPKTIPRTPNGKLEYPKLKDIYLNDFKKLEEHIIYH